MAKKINSIEDAKALLKARQKKAVDQFEFLGLRQYDPKTKIIQPQPLITIQNKTILTMGNYITISGKPKAGKSAIISGILAGAISKENTLGINTNIDAKKDIIHLDTEQGEYEYYQSMDMVKKLAKLSSFPINFKSFRLRGIKAEQIRETITHLADNTNSGLLIIDGLLDTIIDFNNVHECRMITDVLRDITEKNKIGIVCIIHISKSSNYTIGHLGAFADRYSQSVLEVVKEDDCSSLRPVYLRSASSFENVNITYDLNDNIWKLHHTTPEHHKATGKEISDENLIDFITYLFDNPPRPAVIYKQIEDDAKTFFKISHKKVSAIAGRCLELNLIYKEGNNYYKTPLPF